MDLTDTFRLDGKVAVVTGASYGLGVLFAEVLASAGADVVVTARSKDKLEDTKRLVEGLGRRCVAVAGDVTIYEDCEAVVREAMTAFGHIDILVNNAGWADDRLVRTERCEPEMFAKMVGTDLVGLFYMTSAAAPEMLRDGGGSVINLSSIFGNAGAENRTAGYFAAKGGVNQLTRLLACEWGDRNLRVNAAGAELLHLRDDAHAPRRLGDGRLDAQPHTDAAHGGAARAGRTLLVPRLRRIELRDRCRLERRRRLERQRRLRAEPAALGRVERRAEHADRPGHASMTIT